MQGACITSTDLVMSNLCWLKQPSDHDNFLYLYRQSVRICFIFIYHSQILSNSLDMASVGTTYRVTKQYITCYAYYKMKIQWMFKSLWANSFHQSESILLTHPEKCKCILFSHKHYLITLRPPWSWWESFTLSLLVFSMYHSSNGQVESSQQVGDLPHRRACT